MPMASGRQGPSGRFARAVSAEVRASMARQQIKAQELARRVDLSPNYISKRVRDVLPFTMNDIEAVCEALGEDLEGFMLRAARAAQDDSRD